MATPKKKKRKRKQETSDESSLPIIPDDDIQAMKELAKSGDKRPSLDEIKAIANFQAPKGSRPVDASQAGIPKAGDTGDILADLPNIRNVLKNKELKKIEEEEAEQRQRPKISRRDTKAFIEVSKTGSLTAVHCITVED